MASAQVGARILRFGVFELDLRENEFRRAGVLVKLSPQQFRLLRYLAENPGRVCTREELHQNIWGTEVFVDFDRSLNVCVAQVRSALNDDSEGSRYVQTVPRRGYRFVAPVELVEEEPPVTAAPVKKRRLWWILPGALALLAVAWLLWPKPSRVILAVLPFDGGSEIARGLLEEIITQFGTAVPEKLGVIGRTSVNRYAGQAVSLPQIRRDLGAGYVVEGSASESDGRIRVSVRLVSTNDQAQLWSETFEQDQANRFEMQTHITARVVTGVVRTLFPGSPDKSRYRPPPEAREAFLNGQYLQSKEPLRAVEWFQRATERDPKYATAFASLAEAYTVVAFSGAGERVPALEGARAAAQSALRLDESAAEAHNALANVLFWLDWKWDDAGRHYKRAIALNPSFARAHHDHALWQVVMGETEAGVASLKRAIAIDPLSPRVNVDAGWVLLQAHHFDEAIARAQRALELEPGFREAEGCLARARLYSSKPDEKMLELFRKGINHPRAYQRALAHAVLGNKDEAVQALQQSLQEREGLMIMAGTEPAFRPLRGDGRYAEILRKMDVRR